MKRPTCLAGLVILCFLAVVAIGIAETARQRSIVTELAEKTARDFLNDPQNRQQYSLPTDITGLSVQVSDVDSFDLTWTVLVDIDTYGALLVTIEAQRGLPYLPLFNRLEHFIVKTTSFVNGE